MEAVLPAAAVPLIQQSIDFVYSLKPYVEPTVCLGERTILFMTNSSSRVNVAATSNASSNSNQNIDPYPPTQSPRSSRPRSPPWLTRLASITTPYHTPSACSSATPSA